MVYPIYLDNQATTPLDPNVLSSMMPYFSEKFGNAASSHHIYGQEAKQAVEHSREEVSKILRAKPREIIFTSGATEAINLGIKGIVEHSKKSECHIITQETEHKAVLDTYISLQNIGVKISILPVDSDGLLDPDSVKNAINKNTILVSVMHANNEIGTIQSIKEIGLICQNKGVLFLVDACQSFGKLDIDVNDMNINLLAATGHKIYGPKGIGFLYVSQKDPKVKLKMQIEGGGHERGFRSGTLPVSQIVGIGKAVQISQKEKIEENKRLKILRDKLYYGILKSHPEVMLNGSVNKRLAHNLNICFPGLNAESIIMKMRGVACSTGSACSSANLKPSHVIKALGRDNELAHSAIRFSLGRFNSEPEIDKAIFVINNAINLLKEKKSNRSKTII
tara:strand:- start:539 stop:1717 length:1179 start_codon:yes stop_codon:yes gene_type:complete